MSGQPEARCACCRKVWPLASMTTRGHGESEHRVCKRCLPLLLKVHQATTDTEGWEKRERAGNRA